MKKLIASVCAFFLVGGVLAQSGAGSEEVQSPGVVGGVDRVIKQDLSETIQNTVKGTAFFTEDFANGFDGNNGIGPWDPQDSGGDDPIWMVATSSSPGGQYSNTGQALNSTTASNGWIIYDTDLWNTPDIIGDTQGFLISPSIDCSARNTVIVEWQQTFRYCCFSASPLTLGVSSDGGDTWLDFEAHGDFIESANTYSGNNFPGLVDISCAAANEEDVMIRFAYNADFASGYSHYFWGIDDVEVYENAAQNDLRINQVVNGDVFNEWEYRITPIQQAPTSGNGGLLVGTMYENAGGADQTGVTITAEVLDEGGTVLNTTVSEPFDLPAKRNSLECPTFEDTLYLATGWVPDDIGNYTIRVTMDSEQEQDNVEDDIVEKSIVYTECLYGHDDENELDVELRPRDSDTPGLFENVGYGCFYTAKNEGSTAKGVLVRFGPNTDTEYEIDVRLYTIEPGEGLNDATYQSTFYEITPEDVPPSAAASFNVYIPFDDEVDMEVFNSTDFAPVYFVGITNDEESENELTVLAWDLSDTDNSTARINQTGAGDFVWFTSQQQTPFVRLVLDDEECFTTGPSGIEELQELNVTLGQNIPNPATGLTTIRFMMEESLDIDFQITDNMGRIVYTKMMGTLAPGQHEVILDAADFAPGVYQYSLISENKRSTKSMVISK